MYRGSSFLLQRDYLVHLPVVEELLKTEYDALAGIKCVEYRKLEIQQLRERLDRWLRDYYGKVRDDVYEEQNKEKPKNQVTDTLITKVLMGTLGCVPAFDRYFIIGVKKQGKSFGNYSTKSILKLVDFYEENEERLEAVRNGIKVNGLPYPQMKILDMGFWQMGDETRGSDGI